MHTATTLGAVAEVNNRAYDTDLLDARSERVLVGDGAMVTQRQAADLSLDDFDNLEMLNETRPDVIETKYGWLQSG